MVLTLFLSVKSAIMLCSCFANIAANIDLMVALTGKIYNCSGRESFDETFVHFNDEFYDFR